tara:strand:- start:1664 stop:1810 length:147 start_codon:yes stop_codon:yes gene_type:complete
LILFNQSQGSELEVCSSNPLFPYADFTLRKAQSLYIEKKIPGLMFEFF